MLNSKIELLTLKIKQLFEGQVVTTLTEIAEKMNELNESKRIDETNRQIIVFRIVDPKAELTFFKIVNQQSEQLFQLLPLLEDTKMCHSLFELQGSYLGIYLQECNYISLTDLILQKQVNQSMIHEMFIDLVSQMYQLHKQEVTLINFTIDNIFYNRIFNQFCLRYLYDARKIQFFDGNYQINEFPPPELLNKNINPFLIDNWNLGVLILQIYKKINDDNCNNLHALLQRYSISLGGVDYIFINGFYYKNQNDLFWLLEENPDKRPSLEEFIKNIGCPQLSKLINVDNTGSNIIDLNQTLKKCFIKNKILEVRSIHGNKMNLKYLGETQTQTQNNKYINLELGILKINNNKIRANPKICIQHESNLIIIPQHSSIRTIFRIIQLFGDSFGYQIDTSKLLSWMQIQDIIKHVDKQLSFPIQSWDYESQMLSTEQIEELLLVFPKMHLTRVSLHHSSNQIVSFITQKINLSYLRILDLSNSLIEDLSVINCIYISNLNLSNCKQISSSGLLQFFQACALCNLVTLNVSSTQCNDLVFQAIWKNKSLSSLSSLNYSNCSFNTASFISQVLAQLNSKQEQIVELYLSNCKITNQVLMALQQINNLNVLDISENKQINEWHNLKRDNRYHLLNMENCNLSKQDILFLFGFECLKNCKILISEQKRLNIGQLQMSRFISLKNIKAELRDFTNVIQEICLDNSEISNIDFVLQQQMQHLSDLSLQHCNLTDKNIENLVKNQSLQNLVKLNLSNNLLFDVSIISILSILINLRTLHFNDTLISDLSIPAIIQANLQFLSVQNCRMITPNGFCQLLNKDLKVQEIDISRNIIYYELQYFLTNSSYHQTVIYDNQFDYKLLRTFSKCELIIQNGTLDLSRRTYNHQNLEHVLSTNILQKIDLSYTFIKDSDLEIVSIWCSESLTQLILQGCQSLTNECLKYLKQLKKLEIIDLSDTFVKESECIQLIYLNNHKSS